MESQDRTLQHVIYICGYRSIFILSVECGKETSVRANDAIKCDKCGYRILYKKRRTDENEPIQY